MFGFIIALIAGFLTPHLEGPIARPAADALRKVIALDPGEVRLISFMIAMAIAGILCSAFNTGSPMGLIVGGALGYFGLRLSAWAKSALDKRS